MNQIWSHYRSPWIHPDSRYEEHADAHRWSAQGYKWQLYLFDDLTLGREGIQDVWNQLHPGEPVTDYRPPGQ